MRDPRPGDALPTNRDGNQLNFFGDGYGWIVALVVGILALIAVFFLMSDVRSMRNDMDNIRGLIENSAASASRAAVEAAVAAERADKAERSAALNREYAVQVVGQLNRMGYPVVSPGEPDHPVAQPEDYQQLDAYIEERKEQAP